MKLEPKHAAWIADWASQTCDDRIKDAQDEIIRLERFRNDEDAAKAKERIQNLEHFLSQYRAIRAFLVNWKSEIVRRDAQEFAEAIVASFGKRTK